MTRFTEKPDCFIDNSTGLEWSKESLGLMSWNDAMEINHEGWRLPSDNELETLVDRTLRSPVTKLPGMTSSFYWSSLPNANYSNDAWCVNFNNGRVISDYKYNGHYVRLMRVPQNDSLIHRKSYSADDLNQMEHVCRLQGIRTMNSLDYFGVPEYNAQYYIEQEILKTTAIQHNLELTRAFFSHNKETNERYDYVWFMWNNVKFYTILRQDEEL